ncbi:SDR family oxidoreductase [Actinophytocola sp. NPDC049390]|uniref:SDR family oxidoreductase n=1 Tax=Actinophytocola sp. NPDC049390 TaxID=3363894 RepID=UPI0037B5A262
MKALVTGASRGIGRAIAVGLAEDGAEVVGVHYAANRAAASETAALVAAAGAKAVLVEASLNVDGVVGARRIAAEWEGDLDVLVNNAGIDARQPFGEVDEEKYRRIIEINLTAPLFLTQELAPRLRDGGRIVNITTGYTRIAAPTHPAYAAAKAGVNNLGLALAPVFGPRGITVNAVMPGIIDTDMNADWLPEGRAEAAAYSVFNRVGTPADVALVVRYLASDAGRWVTGQVIDATGGSAL